MRKNVFAWISLIALALVVWSAICAPRLMIEPGELIEEHARLADDCFACHTPFLGSSSEKCADCHKVGEIGLKMVNGAPIIKEKKGVAFHQSLLENDCVACHSDHKGALGFGSISQFTHELVALETRAQCFNCHSAPTDALHRQIKANCSDCHTLTAWKPATFEHERLARDVLAQCLNCHSAPTDALHRQIKANCSDCHTLTAWKPSTFEHDKFFRFDRDHPAECAKCHEQNDYRSYSCYGCHEHSAAKIREEHLEEGIRDYENCAKCHKSADEDEAERIWRSMEREPGYMGDDRRAPWRAREDEDDDD